MWILRPQNARYQIFLLLSIAVLGSGAGIMGNVAAKHTTGLMLNGTYRFSIDSPTLFCWAIFGILVLGALAGIMALILSLTEKSETYTQKGGNRTSGKGVKNSLTVAKACSFL